MDRSASALWLARVRAFRSESLPYFRDMARSGVPSVAMLLLLTGLAGYTQLLQNVPPSLPIAEIGTVLLTLAVCWSPLRTWLREADIVFLVPREAEMGLYLRNSLRRSAGFGIARAAAVCAAYLPLYAHGTGRLAPPAVLAAVLALKLANDAGAWQERRLVWSRPRRGMRLLRWAATAVALAALLKAAPWFAAAYIAAAAALAALLYSRLQRYQLPWLRLIAEEARTRRRYYVFFSAFADVPAESARVSARRYASWAAGRIRYRHRSAFAYLYANTLIRTEIGGVVVRFTLFGTFAGWLAAYSALWSGWGAAGVFLLFVWLTGIQLGALAGAHRHSVWRHVYPLQETYRQAALLAIDRIAMLACALVLWVPHALLLPARGAGLPAWIAGLIAAIYILVARPARLKRTFTAMDDE
ncbi:ABC transporter permease [Paenibacillus humicola]|uniref:ABC transporter permease n=1 Tax=Paenibacillus humicola TaxID=3110540 RepID=UPI00237AB291|nr:ABC transporter permease [Paenibacillus humicola]